MLHTEHRAWPIAKTHVPRSSTLLYSAADPVPRPKCLHSGCNQKGAEGLRKVTSNKQSKTDLNRLPNLGPIMCRWCPLSFEEKSQCRFTLFPELETESTKAKIKKPLCTSNPMETETLRKTTTQGPPFPLMERYLLSASPASCDIMATPPLHYVRC